MKLAPSEWAAALPYSFVWFDYISVPQPTVCEVADEDDGGPNHSTKSMHSDHRYRKSKIAEQLQNAVDSIPAYGAYGCLYACTPRSDLYFASS